MTDAGPYWGNRNPSTWHEPHIMSGLTALTTEDYHALLRERDELREEVKRLKEQLLNQHDEIERLRLAAREGVSLRAQVHELRRQIDKHNDECRECPVIEA